MDMGFEKAGFEIVWTNEVDEVFSKLHEAGITSWRKARGNGIKAEIFNKKSITEVSAEKIVEKHFQRESQKILESLVDHLVRILQ
jgi:DNA (cytosine-5)-methyltransferase 1